MTESAILRIENLAVSFANTRGEGPRRGAAPRVQAVHGVSLSV